MKESKKNLANKKLNLENDPLSGDMTDFLNEGGWQVGIFELSKPKNKTITLRISEELLKELKVKAKKIGIDYQRFIRMTLENSLRKKASGL